MSENGNIPKAKTEPYSTIVGLPVLFVAELIILSTAVAVLAIVIGLNFKVDLSSTSLNGRFLILVLIISVFLAILAIFFYIPKIIERLKFWEKNIQNINNSTFGG